jgi:transposase
MVEHIVDVSEPRGRVDIRVGVGRRRRWTDEAKGRIVAESYAPGAVVSEVARRHDISPQHLFVWRKAARAGLLSLPPDEAPAFNRQGSIRLSRRDTGDGAPSRRCSP